MREGEEAHAFKDIDWKIFIINYKSGDYEACLPLNSYNVNARTQPVGAGGL